MTATTARPAPARAGSRASRLSLVFFLIGTGSLHFVVPRVFDAMIPGWIPGPPRFWTYASGVAELASAALLSSARTKRWGGCLAAATMVGVFPANVQMAIENPPVTAWGVALWARLPVQVPLVLWAWAHARPFPPWADAPARPRSRSSPGPHGAPAASPVRAVGQRKSR